MAIVDVTYVGTTSGGDGSYVKVWKVTTDNRFAGAKEIIAASGIDRKGSGYKSGNEADSGSRCNGPQATKDENISSSSAGAVWTVTADFETPEKSEGKEPESPEEVFAEPPKVTWNSIAEEASPIKDLGGNRFVNSAGQDYDPAIVLTVYMQEARITRKEPQYDYKTANDWVWTVNSAPFFGARENYVRLSAVGGVDVWHKELQFWYSEVTYVFHFRRDGGLLGPFSPIYVINRGTLGFPDDASEEAQILPDTDTGIYHTGPRLLDTNGKALKKVKGEYKPTYKAFEVHYGKDFNQLIRPWK